MKGADLGWVRPAPDFAGASHITSAPCQALRGGEVSPLPPAALAVPYCSWKRLFALAQSKPDCISRLQLPWLWATVDASHAELVKPIWGPVHRAGCVRCHMTSCLQPAGAQGHPLPAASFPAQAMRVLPVAGQGSGGSRTGHSAMPACRGMVSVSLCFKPVPPGLSLLSGQWRADPGLAGQCTSSAAQGQALKLLCREKGKFSPLGTWMFPSLPGQSWAFCAAV